MMAGSCASYKQNIMFKVDDTSVVQQHVQAAEKNYVIQTNDLLQLEVYTNHGERIIDPDLELMRDRGVQAGEARPEPNYLVDITGTVRLPLVGEIQLAGLKIREAEELLQKAYEKYYRGSYVILRYVNKRAIVLGAPGGQVVPLTNENVRLTEVLAMAKGINNDAKAHNIRVLRGSNVFVVDFSTIEGYIKGNMVIEPGDIVYVEPVRRPFVESVRDYGALISIVTSLTTLIVVILQIK